MTLFQGFITAAIIALIVVSALHSYFGETRLLKPLFERKGNAVLESELARKVLRYAWHLTSVLFLMIATFLFTLAFNPDHVSKTLLLTIGLGFLCVGLFDLIASRGRHIGWPVLTGIGVFSLAAYSVGGVNL